MEFCPKCGTILMPLRKGKGIKLVCKNCGTWRKLKDEEGYKIKGTSEKKKPKKVVVVDKGKKAKKKPIKKLEYEIDTDAYAELYESY